MKNNNKGSMIILTVIGIATLLVAVIGATFAYFTVQIQGNVTETTVQVQSSTMLVQFATQNKIEYTGAIPGRPLDTDANKLRFTLTSDPDLGVSTKYKVYLVIDSNDFLNHPTLNKPELVYVMNQTGHTTNEPSKIDLDNKDNPMKNTAGTVGRGILNDDEEITVKQEGEEAYKLNVGFIPSVTYKEEDNKTETEKTRILIGEGYLASHGNKDSWELEVWVREMQEQQNYNQGKKLVAHIDIETDSYVSNEEITTP